MTDRKGHREAYELVAELEYLAIEAGLKIRIVDSIRELKEEIQGPLSDEQWQETFLHIEETVAYIEKQIFGTKTEIVIEDEPVVSEEEVREKIRKIWSLTAESVKALQAPYRQEQAFLRQKQEADMINLTNVKANYEIMSDPARFNAKFHESGQVYKQQADKVVADYIDGCAGEYARAMDRIKGVISTIDRGQSSVTVRDIYEKWDKKQELLCQGLKKSAEQLDKGSRRFPHLGKSI